MGLIPLARWRLAVLCDRLDRHGLEIGSATIDVGNGSFIKCSKHLGQYSIHIHSPYVSREAFQPAPISVERAPFPIVVSNEAGSSFYMWDGLNNKLMMTVRGSASAMVEAMAYDAFSQAVVTGTHPESWNYWRTGIPPPSCPYNAAYYAYTAGKDQGQYYCIGLYGANPYLLTNSYYVPRTAITRSHVSPNNYHTWDYRYLTKPTSITGTYNDVGMKPLQVRLYADPSDGVRAAEWTALTGQAWTTDTSTYNDTFGGSAFHVYPRSQYYYHSLFDVSLHSPVVAVIPETMPAASISMLDSWRDVYCGGFLLNVGTYAEQVAGGGPWMNRVVGMDSVGGVVETDNSIVVYEAAAIIASLPAVWSWVGPASGTYTVTDDGTIHNDGDSQDGDDETLLIGQILALTNQRRKEAGVPPLTINSKLTIAAKRHADDMAAGDFLSHTGSDGSTASERITDAGYFDGLYPGSGTSTEENVGSGYVTAETLMAAWVASPSHYANIIDEDMWDIGIAVSFRPETWDWNDRRDRGKPFFVQTFGYRSDRKYKRLFRIWAHQKDALVGTQKVVLDLINSERADAGAPALMENMALWRVAQDTAQYGDGDLTLAERLSIAGYDMWVDKDYVTINSYEQTMDGVGAIDAEFLSTDYVEASVGYYDGKVVIVAGKVGDRWPGLTPICTTGMDLYHFTNSDPVSSSQSWVDSVPDVQDVESFRLPLVYAI